MKKILLLSASLLAALSVKATTVNVNPGHSETTLDEIVAGTSIDVNGAGPNGQLANDNYFTAPSLSGLMVIEIAGYAPNNAFGIYEKDTGNMHEIFNGIAGAGATSALVDLSSLVGWTSTTFGFYLQNAVQNFIWYSDETLNAVLPGGPSYDHFVTYKGTAGETMTASGITFGANDYLIGIEDLNLGDYDYNDMVVKVSLTPTTTTHTVPDHGATVALMGLGLAALAAVRRRQN